MCEVFTWHMQNLALMWAGCTVIYSRDYLPRPANHKIAQNPRVAGNSAVCH